MIFSLSRDGDAATNNSITKPISEYTGHKNSLTVKEARFFGPWIVSGSDCGHFYIWNRSGKLLVRKRADYATVNVVAPHPSLPMLVTSGIESNVKIWDVRGNDEHAAADSSSDEHEIEDDENAILLFLFRQQQQQQQQQQHDDDDDDNDSSEDEDADYENPRERWFV